jgi:hypothetical protein
MGVKRTISTLAAAVLITSTFAQAAMAEGTNAASNQRIPLRQAADWLGAKVAWDAKNKAASVTYGEQEWTVFLGKTDSKLNQQPLQLSNAAIMNDQQMLEVQLRDINKALNTQLNLKGEGTVDLTSSDAKTLASHIIKALVEGNAEEVQFYMSDTLKTSVPLSTLQLMQQQLKAMYGNVDQLLNQAETTNAIHNNVRLMYSGPLGAPFAIDVRFNHAGQLDDMFFPTSLVDTYKAPDYDHPDRYAEEEVLIGDKTLGLPGTLTVPKGEGPFPVVVLVHGSGPNDRNETIGGGKTFRDLAVGLANEGIAVLRYDKRTYEHNLKSMAPTFTVREETTNDAIAAVEMLKSDQRFNSKQIYVLGHSQGGMLVPRIIEQDRNHDIAGALIFAGPSEPLEDVMLVQFQQGLERAKKAGAPQEALAQYEAQIEGWKQVLTLLKDPQYSVDNIPPKFPTANAVWWYDLRNYKGQEIAKNQKLPLFIAQGDNDVQVNASHLDGWKKGLASRTNVEYKLYPKLNHLFVPSDQPSTGSEYMLPGNVPSEVITDVAKWVKSTK